VSRPPGTLVAFYGDSYTLGTGASAPSRRWSTIICAEREWQEFNPSVNGLGFIRNRHVFGDGDLPSAIIAERPDILFITLGLNDNFAYEVAAASIESQISTDFDRLAAALPATRFVVVEPFWYQDERPASVDTIISWVRAAAARIGAEYIAGASHWIDGHPEWKARDLLHPNDAGYAAIAQRFDLALRNLGL
jgi:lysophospholipase L1-like esterase